MKIVLTVFGLVLAGLLSMPVARAEGMPGTPTVLVPTSTAHVSQVKPVLAGVTQSGTQVDVYIDNQFYGRATVVEGTSGTAHWSYVPFLNLSHGWHTVQVKAQNAVGARSLVSQPTYVFVDLLVPSPTLLSPVVNADTVASKPWIVGLTKGGMALDVWIDGELNGSVEVEGDVQDTVSFKYQPFLPLSVGTHHVSVVAKDPYGGQSQAATMSFKVAVPVQRTADVTSTSAESASTEAMTSTEESASSEAQTEPGTSEAEEAEVQPEPTEVAPSEEAPGEEAPAEVQPEADTSTEPESTEEANQPTEEASEQPASESTEEGPAASDEEGRSNVLSTVGWVLLALVAIGMITRGRGKPKADELVKLDTTGSTPHVEVIRKADQAPGTTSSSPSASTPTVTTSPTPSTSNPSGSKTQVPPSTKASTPNTPSA